MIFFSAKERADWTCGETLCNVTYEATLWSKPVVYVHNIASRNRLFTWSYQILLLVAKSARTFHIFGCLCQLLIFARISWLPRSGHVVSQARDLLRLHPYPFHKNNQSMRALAFQPRQESFNANEPTHDTLTQTANCICSVSCKLAKE